MSWNRGICWLLSISGLLLVCAEPADADGRLFGRLRDAGKNIAFAAAYSDSTGAAGDALPQVPPDTSASEKSPATPQASAIAVSNSSEPIAVPTATASESISGAPCDCGGLRPGDQIWLISTRRLGCPAEKSEPALDVSRYDAAGWHSASLADFLAADNPAVPTDFYVHGNFETACGAQANGLTIYSRLVACAAAARPIRFVIWSWPTDPGHHKVQLIREHACRADTDAWYLGWLLGRMNPRVPVGLMGYSFGARVVTGAMHVLGGGEMFGMTLALPSPPPKRTVRAVLVAAAEDCYALYPGQANGNALSVAERMLLMNNGCDQALRLYPHLDPCCPADALGYVGLGGNYPNVEQLDACCAVGKKHDWRLYFCNESIVAQMRPYLFLDPIQPIAALRKAGVALASAVCQCLGERVPLASAVKWCVRESVPLACAVGQWF